MKIIVLASGSKGNATYIQTSKVKILIDAGISYLQLRQRLFARGIALDTLDAILVTHEHVDHTKYLASIAKKTNATIYMSEIAYPNINKRLSGALKSLPVSYVLENTKYEIKDLTVVPIKLSHDVNICLGYLFKENPGENKTYGYITDTGYIPNEYLSIISKLQAISIESNHDIKMLKESTRPWPIIQRILSNEGHLSNVQCSNYIKAFDYKYVKVLILSHISEECNTENHIMKEVNQVFEGHIPCHIEIAKQNEPLEVIEVA